MDWWHRHEWELEQVFCSDTLQLKDHLVKGRLKDFGLTELIHLAEQSCTVKTVTVTRACSTGTTSPLFGGGTGNPLYAEFTDLQVFVEKFLFGPTAINNVFDSWDGQRGLSHIR